MKSKKGLVWYEFGKWVLALAAAALIIFFIYSLATGKLEEALARLAELFSFGR